MKSKQLLTQGKIFEDEILAGTNDAANPAEEVPKSNDQDQNLTGTSPIEPITKRLILRMYDVSTTHSGCPLLSSHLYLGAAPQVGHRTASIYVGLSSCVTHKPLRTKGLVNSGKPIWTLRPPDYGHGPLLQKGADKCAIYLQAAVVADEPFLLEPIHKFIYPFAGSTNHLG